MRPTPCFFILICVIITTGGDNIKTRKDAVDFCLTFKDVYEDHPFSDQNWTLMRHKENRKSFATIYQHEGNIWINVKCSPDFTYMWRNAFQSVVPAYHMNKEHWLTVALDGSVLEENLKFLLALSF